MGRIIVPFIGIFFCIFPSFAQHHISVGGGYNQSIYYCGLSNSEYYTTFRPYDSYLVNITYKKDMPVKKGNMRIGGQWEWKRQSAYFYYEDRRDGDTIPTGMRYDLPVIQLYIFPELVVGDPIRFIFNGGPCIEYILSSHAKGIRLINDERVEVDETNNGDVEGLYVGAKINLGLEFPVYKNLYITLQNSYSAGLSSKGGRLKEQMKYYNCLDINLSGSICYKIIPKTK